jgi:AcrR family transcriptional regulator
LEILKYNSHMQPSRTPRRTQEERTRTSRAKIIHSATESFARNGFRGAKMSDIARDASLTGPGLLHHFPSKTHLLMEVLKERDQIDGQRVQTFLEKNGNDFLGALIELVEHNQTVPGLVQLFNLLVAESVSLDHPAHEYFKERYQRGREHWTQVITQAQQAGEVRSDLSAETLAQLLFAMMDGLQVQWLLEPKKINMAELFQVMTDMLRKK